MLCMHMLSLKYVCFHIHISLSIAMKTSPDCNFPNFVYISGKYPLEHVTGSGPNQSEFRGAPWLEGERNGVFALLMIPTMYTSTVVKDLASVMRQKLNGKFENGLRVRR
jgi:hypothetical protein